MGGEVRGWKMAFGGWRMEKGVFDITPASIHLILRPARGVGIKVNQGESR